MPRALVVEDEANIRDLILLHLALNGLETDAVADGREALVRIRDRDYDLVVLDLMLPGLDGLSVCRAVRLDPRNRDVPILMLTARRDETDKVIGLESGADDYLTKPFGVQEFAARVRALLRRPRASHAAAPGEPGAARTIAIADLEIDPSRHRVRLDHRDIDLTAQEFDLLYLLASHPGIVFSRDALLQRIWGAGTHVTGRSVDALVKRLRRKVERDPGDPARILTVWGVGYKFRDV